MIVLVVCQIGTATAIPYLNSIQLFSFVYRLS